MIACQILVTMTEHVQMESIATRVPVQPDILVITVP